MFTQRVSKLKDYSDNTNMEINTKSTIASEAKIFDEAPSFSFFKDQLSRKLEVQTYESLIFNPSPVINVHLAGDGQCINPLYLVLKFNFFYRRA